MYRDYAAKSGHNTTFFKDRAVAMGLAYLLDHSVMGRTRKAIVELHSHTLNNCAL